MRYRCAGGWWRIGDDFIPKVCTADDSLVMVVAVLKMVAAVVVLLVMRAQQTTPTVSLIASRNLRKH